MNPSKLIGLIPNDPEIKKIKSKYKRISTFVNTARCRAFIKDKQAGESIDSALAAVNELHKKDIGKRALFYAGCAESYSILPGIERKKSSSAVKDAIKELTGAKTSSRIPDHDKIITSIAKTGVNLDDIKIVNSARELCNKIQHGEDIVPSLCVVAKCYARLGDAEKAFELVKSAQNDLLKRKFDNKLMGHLMGDIAITLVKIAGITRKFIYLRKAKDEIEMLSDLLRERRGVCEDKKSDEMIVSFNERITYIAGVRVIINLIPPGTMRTDLADRFMKVNEKFWKRPVQYFNRLSGGDVLWSSHLHRALLDTANVFYCLEENKTSGNILKSPELNLSYSRENLPLLIEMAMLWENMDAKHSGKIINEFYNKIKEADVEERAAMLSEILMLIHCDKINKN